MYDFINLWLPHVVSPQLCSVRNTSFNPLYDVTFIFFPTLHNV